MQLFQPAMRWNKQTEDCRCCSSGDVCEAKAVGVNLQCSQKKTWFSHCGWVWVLWLVPWQEQVLHEQQHSHSSRVTSGPPTFLSGGRIEVFFTWSYTNYISSVALQCNDKAAKGRRGPPESRHVSLTIVGEVPPESRHVSLNTARYAREWSCPGTRD